MARTAQGSAGCCQRHTTGAFPRSIVLSVPKTPIYLHSCIIERYDPGVMPDVRLVPTSDTPALSPDMAAVLNKLLRRLLTAGTASAVTQAAVETVREALDVDLSWCGLVNGGYLHMGAYSGVRTTEMMSIWRLAIGSGIGGRVAQQGRTLAVRDYRHDRRRVPEMKSVIDEEGVRCALCAPLANGPDILGVVYAAQRDAREWTDHEIRMLTDVGRYCGVVLGRIDDLRRDRERTEVARIAEETTGRALKTLHATADAVAATEDPAVAVEMLAHHLGRRVELIDLAGEVLRAAPSATGAEQPTVWERQVSDESLGVLRIRGDRALDATEDNVAGVSARMIGLQLARERAALRAEGRLRGQLLHELLEGDPGVSNDLRERAMLLGIDLAIPRHVVCLGRHHAHQDLAGTALADAETAIHARFPRSISVPHPSKVVVLLNPGTDRFEHIQNVLRRVADRTRTGESGFCVGIGRVCRTLPDYADSYAEAALALEVSSRRPQPCSVVGPADLGFYGLLARATGQPSLDALVAEVLGPLLDADAAAGSEYVKTLNAFLVCDRHLERTAASLHVHPNTVRYRLSKAQDKLGIDVRDGEHRFLLELALRIRAALDEHSLP